jgi:hypothetical protein
MGVGTPTKSITVQYKDGSEEDIDIQGNFWAWREFVCFRRAGEERVTYIPNSNVNAVLG